MATLPRRYCFLYPKGEEKNITGDVLNAYKLISEPYLYRTAQYSYELLIDGDISTNAEYVNLQDYDIFWELIIKLLTDPSFITNQLYLNYGASEIKKDTDYIEFAFASQEWKIYLTFARLEDEYPVTDQYLIFYDADDNISYNELYPTMGFFCDKLGKDNKYTGVKEYIYQDSVKLQRFYVFYCGDAPSDSICKIQIRNYLVTKLGYDTAKAQFPNFFIDTYRNIFLMYNNEGYPIDYTKLKVFVDENDLFHPEVLLLLDWMCPLIVEGGVSDIIPNYSPVEEVDNIESNNFIFYLSKVLNYLRGVVLTPSFRVEANFLETDEYCEFVYSGLGWRVQKWTYQLLS